MFSPQSTKKNCLCRQLESRERSVIKNCAAGANSIFFDPPRSITVGGRNSKPWSESRSRHCEEQSRNLLCTKFLVYLRCPIGRGDKERSTKRIVGRVRGCSLAYCTVRIPFGDSSRFRHTARTHAHTHVGEGSDSLPASRVRHEETKRTARWNLRATRN